MLTRAYIKRLSVLLNRRDNIKLKCRFQSSFKLPTSFYLAVHPDFFNGYPLEQKTNEESLQVLHSYLNGLKSKDPVYSTTLTFYLKDESKPDNNVISQVKMLLEGKSTSRILSNILKACNLPDERLESEQKSSKKSGGWEKMPETTFVDEKEWYSEFGNFSTSTPIRTLGSWLDKNHKTVEISQKNARVLNHRITEIMQVLNTRYGIKGLSKECFDYSLSMVYNALKHLQMMLDRYFSGSHVLNGRLVKFGNFNGFDQLGKVLFNINDVPSDWRLGVSTVSMAPLLLNKIKELEFSLKDRCFGLNFIRPRSGLHSCPAPLYLKGLDDIYSYMSKGFDYGEQTKKYKDILSVYDWHADFISISPEGYLEVPAQCSRSHIQDYLDGNVMNIRKARKEYLQNLQLEQTSISSCKLKLGLYSLEKELTINTAQTVKACEELKLCDNVGLMKHWSVILSNYYSISANGLVRIPWDFQH